MRPSNTSAVLLACFLLAPCPALGQQGAGSATAKQQADEHFSRGQELFTAGEYTKAAEAFELAYEIHPHQAVLANIAMCYDKAGKLAQAVVVYRRYLANPVDAGKNTKMQDRLRELEALVGELDIDCPETQCRVEVDGIDRGTAPVSVVVLPGSHRVEAFSGEERIAVANGRVGRGEVTGIALGVTAEAEEQPAADATVSPDGTETDDGVSLGAPFWVATGLTVATGAATIAFGVLTVDAHDRYEAADRLDDEAKEEGERYRLLTNVMVGITTAAAATATGFAIHALVSDGDEDQVAITTGPGLGIGVAGEF